MFGGMCSGEGVVDICIKLYATIDQALGVRSDVKMSWQGKVHARIKSIKNVLFETQSLRAAFWLHRIEYLAVELTVVRLVEGNGVKMTNRDAISLDVTTCQRWIMSYTIFQTCAINARYHLTKQEFGMCSVLLPAIQGVYTTL